MGLFIFLFRWCWSLSLSWRWFLWCFLCWWCSLGIVKSAESHSLISQLCGRKVIRNHQDQQSFLLWAVWLCPYNNKLCINTYIRLYQHQHQLFYSIGLPTLYLLHYLNRQGFSGKYLFLIREYESIIIMRHEYQWLFYWYTSSMIDMQMIFIFKNQVSIIINSFPILTYFLDCTT